MQRKIVELTKEISRKPKGTLYIKHGKRYTAFTHYINRSEGNINRDSNLIYALARKKYLQAYIPSLENGDRRRVDELLRDFADAGLEIRRITLTPEQYQWVTRDYKHNPTRPDCLKYTSNEGTATRSKSEKIIANLYDHLGIPYRYECALTIDVSRLLMKLDNVTRDYRHGTPLYHYSGGICIWNVPKELEWLNNPGSIWRSYNDRNGTITIYPDFTIMTFDRQLIVHEHEGIAVDPYYRCNASERIFVMRESGLVKDDHLITTFESDIIDESILTHIVKNRILPLI